MGRFFFALGLGGPFTLGIIDALLFVPLANDVLVVALAASHRDRAFLYAVSAVVGSVLGCFFLDAASRKGGEAGLKKILSKKKLDRVKRSITSRAGWAVATASLMPPPFPFTPVVAGAAAFQYPRWKLLSIIAAARLVRFCVLAWLALRYGTTILKWAQLPVVRWSVIGLIVISVVGSSWTLWTRLRRR